MVRPGRKELQIFSNIKMPFCYIRICGEASDAVDAVRSASPEGFKFLNLELNINLNFNIKIFFQNLKRSI